MKDVHRTVPELIDALGGASEVARLIARQPSTASEMKRRQSIPVRYWPALVAGAKAKGIDDLTYETLVAVHSKSEAAA